MLFFNTDRHMAFAFLPPLKQMLPLFLNQKPFIILHFDLVDLVDLVDQVDLVDPMDLVNLVKLVELVDLCWFRWLRWFL